MSDVRTLLETTAFSAGAQRALVGPGRMMAARGLMPLPPGDQVAVLYQLALDTDATISAAARTTAAGLPEKLLTGTLADARIDPRVLDFFGELALDKPTVFEAVALNTATLDTTIAFLAGKAPQAQVELIATNEKRLLRHPEIIAAMYMNRRARMSTIDRVVELAVRNNVRVPGLAAWDEVAKALGGDAAGSENDELLDALLEPGRDDSSITSGDAEQLLAEDEANTGAEGMVRLMLDIQNADGTRTRVPLRRTRMMLGSAETADAVIPGAPAQWLAVECEERRVTIVVRATTARHQVGLNQTALIDNVQIRVAEVPFRELSASAKVRAAMLGDAFTRGEAIRDPLRLVAMAGIKSPGVTDIEAARYAGNQLLSEDVIRYIAAQREWTKMYAVKVLLCKNPKAPIAEVTRLLPFLRERDLQNLIKSKGVASAVVAQARKLHMARGGGKK